MTFTRSAAGSYKRDRDRQAKLEADATNARNRDVEFALGGRTRTAPPIVDFEGVPALVDMLRNVTGRSMSFVSTSAPWSDHISAGRCVVQRCRACCGWVSLEDLAMSRFQQMTTDVGKTNPTIKRLLLVTVGSRFKGRKVAVDEVSDHFSYNLPFDPDYGSLDRTFIVSASGAGRREVQQPTASHPNVEVGFDNFSEFGGACVLVYRGGERERVTIYIPALDPATLSIATDALSVTSAAQARHSSSSALTPGSHRRLQKHT